MRETNPFSSGKLKYFEKFNKLFYATGGYDDYLKRFKSQGLDYAERLIKAIKAKKSWRFLDIGCGMGGIVLALRKMGYKAWGTEVSPFCLQNSPAKKWIKLGEICSLPFPNNSFDVVLTIDVLCYLDKNEIKMAVNEFSRINTKFLYLETISKNSPNSKQKINPDSLRKDKFLLNEKELISLLRKKDFQPLSILFNPAEKKDFNYLFLKIAPFT
jgi:ubiquinone/menaquinone biosynthesis C-methylase UbiE